MDHPLTRFFLARTRMWKHGLVNKYKQKGDVFDLNARMSAFSLVQYPFTEWSEKLLTDGVPDLSFKHFADVPCSHHHRSQLEQGWELATFTRVRVAEGLLSVQPNADILPARWSWIGASPRALVVSSSAGCWALRPRSPARPGAFHWRVWKSKEREVHAVGYSSHCDKAGESPYLTFQVYPAQTS